MKRINRRKFMLLASVGASGAVLTACGNTESTDANLNPTMIPDVAGAPPTLVPQATPGGASAEQQQPAQQAQGGGAQQQPAQQAQGGSGQAHIVEMNLQLQYVPAELTVNVGDTVTWRTVGPIPHTSTCDPSLAADPAHVALPQGAETWNSGDVADGQEFSHTFEVAGDYTYFCIPHEAAGMIGSVTVQEAGAAPAAGGGQPAEASPAAQQPPAQPAQAAGGQGQAHVVEMNLQLQYVPAELTVAVGDTVTWRTVGPIPHTSTCDPTLAANPAQSVALPQGAEPWNSGDVADGQEFSHTFEVAGDYTYFCIPHEAAGMIGSVTVQ